MKSIPEMSQITACRDLAGGSRAFSFSLEPGVHDVGNSGLLHLLPSPVMDPGDQKLSIESSPFKRLRRGFVTLQSHFKDRWRGVRLRKGGGRLGFLLMPLQHCPSKI